MEGDYFYITDDGEITISGKPTNDSLRVNIEKRKVKIPEDMLQEKLSYEESDSIAIIDRQNSLALKTLTVGTPQGKWAGLVEHESAHQICRELCTNPAPENLLERLTLKCESLRLDRDPVPFLRQRESLQAWLARRLLGIPDSADDEQAPKKADQRLACQREDGSWESAVLPTVKMLKELLSLGIPASHPAAPIGLLRMLPWVIENQNPDVFWGQDEKKIADIIPV